MQKRQAQLQKLIEELLPDHLDDLLKDALHSLDSAWDSAKDTAKDTVKDAKKDVSGNLNRDRHKLEALGRDALESLDRDKLEKVVREALHSLDTDKLEKWARKSLRSVDNDKLKRLLRDKLGGLDKDKLEDLLKDGMRHIDRHKLEESVRDRIRSLDLDKIKSAARSSINDFDPHKIESFVNARVDSVVRARLDALDADELEKLLDSKRAALAIEEGKRKGKGKAAKNELKKASKKDAKVTVKVEDESSSNPITTLIGTLGRFAILGAAGWIAYSHLFLEHQVPLPKAIAAELLTLVYRPSGPINIYQDRGGSGRPLVLIHSINAAASSYEMRPLFQHYRGDRPVFALDLPGFGFSARTNIEYTPEIYVNAIITLLAGLDGEPADVVALSLGSEFAAEAARRRPELFHSLALISPSGMYQKDSARSSQAASAQGFDPYIYPLLSFRLWSRPIYDLLTTRQSIAYFLQRSFVGAIPDGMVDYSIATSHQPGAEHAPLYFVSGKLFSPNALDKIYKQVNTPSLVIYDQDAFVRFDRLPELLATNKAWQATRISPTLGLPHWEKLEETTKALDAFWETVKVPA
jgi:pimeloyl-ACP methyl ester carboxylesterase